MPRKLYLMAKPPRQPLAAILAQPRKDARRPDLAHVTLLPFADLDDEPDSLVPDLVEAMRGFHARAFHLLFDQVTERHCVTLRSRKSLREARRFQANLARHLASRGFTDFGRAPEVHLTLNYHRDGLGRQTIVPIEWRVDEVLLVESVHGRSLHVEHGRWPLAPLLL